MTEQKKKLIVVADDFGVCESVNRGCIDTLQNGILTEMSIMLKSPGTDNARKLADEALLDRHIGLHLTFNDFTKIGRNLKTEEYNALLETAPQKELEQIVSDEFKEFEDMFGRVPSHINGHKNSHTHERFLISSHHMQRKMIYMSGQIEIFQMATILPRKTSTKNTSTQE